jgi:UDP-hydrolysing UDP-N-acetyl-D-glucosamine 2-epimerase
MSEMKQRRICVVLADRANYGRLWPVMREIQGRADLELLTMCSGTMLLERFGRAERVVEQDGFRIDSRVFLEVEGSVPVTMAKSIGLGIIEFANEFLRLCPDIVLLIGDRYEALAAAIAAAYMNIPVAHIQGGEVSGSIDESARHAITRFAQIHFPSTARSAEYLVRMGEPAENVHFVGCPAGDYVRNLDTVLPDNLLAKEGVGAEFDMNGPFFLVIYHPVTTEYGTERAHVEALLTALDELQHPTLWLWPNIDAGADDVSKAIRIYREHHRNGWLHLVKNLEPEAFQKCLKKTVCAIGNSSSFIRDSTFTGTPVVLVGNRQVGRETGFNLMAVKPGKGEILHAIRRQLEHGRYPPSDLYGTGGAAARICDVLSKPIPPQQKRLDYIFREETGG